MRSQAGLRKIAEMLIDKIYIFKKFFVQGPVVLVSGLFVVLRGNPWQHTAAFIYRRVAEYPIPMKSKDQSNPPAFEVLAIMAICFGWSMLASFVAVSAGFHNAPFSDGMFASMIATELILGAVALLVLRARGYAISEFFPSPTLTGCLIGVALYAAAVVACSLVIAPFGATAYEAQPIHDMVAQARPSLSMLVAVGMVNGLYEEMFLLGYLVRGFAKRDPSLALGMSLLVRLLYHLYQGPIGALSVLVIGFVFGLFYLRTGRLWPVVFAHTVADILPFM